MPQHGPTEAAPFPTIISHSTKHIPDVPSHFYKTQQMKYKNPKKERKWKKDNKIEKKTIE